MQQCGGKIPYRRGGCESIQSPDVEIVFVEDNSTDDTAALIEKEASTLDVDWRMERGRFGGPGPARDHGVAVSSGKYLWFADADDLMMPQAIIAQLPEFRERDHDYYAFGIIKFVKSKDNAVTADKVRFMPTADAQSLFERMQPLWMCNIIFRRAFLDQHDIGFLPHVYVQVDFYMIVQVLVHAKTYRIIDTYGYEYLHHANSLSHEQIRPRSLSKWISTIRILEFVETHAPEEYETFDIAAQKIGLVYDWSRYIESGQYRDLIEAFPYIIAILRQHGSGTPYRDVPQYGFSSQPDAAAFRLLVCTRKGAVPRLRSRRSETLLSRKGTRQRREDRRAAVKPFSYSIPMCLMPPPRFHGRKRHGI